MDLRRPCGVMLLIDALLGSLLIPRVGGMRIVGTVSPIGTAPQVGACLHAATGSLAASTRGGFPPVPLSVTSVGETTVSFSDCSDQHVGEVVAVRLTPRHHSDGTIRDVSDTEWCNSIASSNRTRTIKRFSHSPDDAWKPETSLRFLAILGGYRETSWAACAVLAPGFELYSGSYISSLEGRPTPAPFGTCRSGRNPDRQVSCTSPHSVQEFAVSAGGSSSTDVVGRCTSLVQAMTGLPDVNADGLFRVQVVHDSPPAGDVYVDRCRLTVVAPHRLIGTMIGVGAGKLPLI